MCKKFCFLMSVVLVLGLVGSAPAVINPGRGAFIIIITDSGESEVAVLEPFLQGIYGPGVSIEAISNKYEELDAEKITTLKSANLIIVTDDASTSGYETITPDDKPTGLNLALDQPVDSNSNEVVDEVELVPENAVDGDTGTRWASEANDPQWIYVDLGSEVLVNVVRLNWEAAYAKSYKIQVSNDACDWTDVYSTTSGNGETDQIYLEDVTTRYVRMYGTKRGHTGGDELYGYSLWEFEVYGSGPPAGATPEGESSEIEFWNGLEIPMLLLQDDMGRSFSNVNYRWRWYDAKGENEDWVPDEFGVYIDVNDACDPIWDGVTIDDACQVRFMYWDFEKTPEIPECNSAGYGTLLAKADVGESEPNLILARWAPGTQFWEDPCNPNPQIAGGPRIFFAMESLDPQLSDLTPDGEKLMENMITELLQYTYDPNIAYGPYPRPGEPAAPIDAKLHWTPGDNVGLGGGLNGHMLYFSTNWADVNSRDLAKAAQTEYFMDVNEWDPFDAGYLAYGQTYYWCIDEFNSGHPDGGYPDTLWRGPVWSFTAAPSCSLCCVDFECYATTDELRACWSNTEFTTLTLETGETAIAHESAQAMCMNTYYEVGAATLTFTPPASWPEHTKAMGVWFHGDAANVLAGAQLFLTIEDGTGDSNTVYYDGDMNDLTEENWHQWGIDLADFRDAVPAVDLLDVKKLTLGFGNAGEESSTIYFDDIEIFEWMCLEGTSPEGDFTGPGGFNDCVVDTWDLMEFTDVWLEHEYVIYAEPVTDDACAHWDFEEGTGSTVADITGNGNIGRFLVDCNYPDGYDPDSANKPEWVAGKVGTWALHFDGNDFVRIEGTEGATVECANEPFTMCIWLNYDEYDEENHPGTMTVFYKGCDKAAAWPTSYYGGEWEGSARRYHMHFGPGGTEDDSDLSIQIDDDDDKTRIHGYRQMDPNVWYHAAIQRDWDAAKLRVYLNGELIVEDTDDSQNSYIASVGEPLMIGMKINHSSPPRWNGSRFIGKLDDMRIYKSVLSEGQLLTVMGLSERFVPLHHTEFNPVEDWIINFEDAAIIADNWGANTRFP